MDHVQYPDMVELGKQEKLSFEKECLGFYISGHPLDNVMDTLKRFTTMNTTEAHAAEDVKEVVMGGVVQTLKEIKTPLTFQYHGCRKVSPMFGPEGMAKVVALALQSLAARGVSFTLEIHPTFEQLPLGEASSLFIHWTDKTDAEQMNHWLDLLSRKHELLKQAIKAASLDQGTAVP